MPKEDADKSDKTVRKYEVYEPFEIPRDKFGRIEKDQHKEFWEAVEERVKGLSEASGCYIFGLRAGKEVTP